MAIIHFIQVIIACVYVLFMPGFVISFLFLKPGTLDYLQRAAISLALSISVVPVFSYYLSYLGIPKSFWSILVEIAVLIALAVLCLYLKNILLPQKRRHG